MFMVMTWFLSDCSGSLFKKNGCQMTSFVCVWSVKNETGLEEALWHYTEVVLSMLLITNHLLYCISSIRPGMTAADTHSFPSHSKQISILTYEQSPASHSKGKLEMSTMGGILCTRNGTLPSEDPKVLMFTSHLLPLHPCSELDSISFYWVFIGLRLYPWCFYCLPAFLHSALTCIILFRVHKISGMYLALFLYSQYGINISLWFWG